MYNYRLVCQTHVIELKCNQKLKLKQGSIPFLSNMFTFNQFSAVMTFAFIEGAAKSGISHDLYFFTGRIAYIYFLQHFTQTSQHQSA